mmetsp:Transcript_6693/g.25088  ORF Transcript_6693/g.25088 Transcript_6693/m.25088 type:complete len:290 (+) Transcript_6693:880-1749(+)
MAALRAMASGRDEASSICRRTDRARRHCWPRSQAFMTEPKLTTVGLSRCRNRSAKSCRADSQRPFFPQVLIVALKAIASGNRSSSLERASSCTAPSHLDPRSKAPTAATNPMLSSTKPSPCMPSRADSEASQAEALLQAAMATLQAIRLDLPWAFGSRPRISTRAASHMSALPRACTAMPRSLGSVSCPLAASSSSPALCRSSGVDRRNRSRANASLASETSRSAEPAAAAASGGRAPVAPPPPSPASSPLRRGAEGVSVWPCGEARCPMSKRKTDLCPVLWPDGSQAT